MTACQAYIKFLCLSRFFAILEYVISRRPYSLVRAHVLASSSCWQPVSGTRRRSLPCRANRLTEHRLLLVRNSSSTGKEEEGEKRRATTRVRIHPVDSRAKLNGKFVRPDRSISKDGVFPYRTIISTKRERCTSTDRSRIRISFFERRSSERELSIVIRSAIGRKG